MGEVIVLVASETLKGRRASFARVAFVHFVSFVIARDEQGLSLNGPPVVRWKDSPCESKVIFCKSIDKQNNLLYNIDETFETYHPIGFFRLVYITTQSSLGGGHD